MSSLMAEAGRPAQELALWASGLGLLGLGLEGLGTLDPKP